MGNCLDVFSASYQASCKQHKNDLIATEICQYETYSLFNKELQEYFKDKIFLFQTQNE